MYRYNKRTKKDYLEIKKLNKKKTNQSICLKTLGYKLNHFHATINGPNGTPYENGKFVLCMHVPKKYPSLPPQVVFKTKVWHPNVSTRTGAICLDILAERWSSKLSLRTVLISIQALLSAPEAEAPLDPEVGRQCKSNPDMFNFTVKVWVHLYAKGKHPVMEYEDNLKYMVNMGVPKHNAVYILSICDWDLPESVKKAFQMLKNFEFYIH